MVDYQEYPPIPALRTHLVCVWTCRVPSAHVPASYRVLPDNCIDILWHDDGISSFATGMMTASKMVTLAPPTRIVAVRFKPGHTAPFFRLPLNELTDIHAGIDTLWGKDAAERLHHALWNRHRSEHECLQIVQRHLLDRLHRQAPKTGHALIGHAVQVIESSHGMLKIDALAQHLGVTRQHLASRFRAEVGIPAKTFARICRFQRALSDIRSSSSQHIDWSALALDRGYFDQSHLIHEFQEFAVSTPDCFANRTSLAA